MACLTGIMKDEIYFFIQQIFIEYLTVYILLLVSELNFACNYHTILNIKVMYTSGEVLHNILFSGDL